jgi:hypothetical protein
LSASFPLPTPSRSILDLFYVFLVVYSLLPTHSGSDHACGMACMARFAVGSKFKMSIFGLTASHFNSLCCPIHLAYICFKWLLEHDQRHE